MQTINSARHKLSPLQSSPENLIQPIQQISFEDTYQLRQKILRPHLTKDASSFFKDELYTTYHFGYFYKNQIIAVASLFSEPCEELPAGCPYRLRGMATHSDYQKQGYGKLLLRYCTEFLKLRGCDLLWFNARINAFGFYERLGFRACGDFFEIKDIGIHKVMYKHLLRR